MPKGKENFQFFFYEKEVLLKGEKCMKSEDEQMIQRIMDTDTMGYASVYDSGSGKREEYLVALTAENLASLIGRKGGETRQMHLSTKIGHKFFNFLQLFPFFRQFIFLIYSSLFGLADPIRFFIIVKPACALLPQLWA